MSAPSRSCCSGVYTSGSQQELSLHSPIWSHWSHWLHWSRWASHEGFVSPHVLGARRPLHFTSGPRWTHQAYTARRRRHRPRMGWGFPQRHVDPDPKSLGKSQIRKVIIQKRNTTKSDSLGDRFWPHQISWLQKVASDLREFSSQATMWGLENTIRSSLVSILKLKRSNLGW